MARASLAISCTWATQEGVGSAGSTPEGSAPGWMGAASAHTVGITTVPAALAP